MAGKARWEIDSTGLKKEHIITGQDELKKFSFTVTRLKDIYSNEEVLRIKAFYDNKECGIRISKLSKLDTEIVTLADIGVSLTRGQYIELSSIIKNNYYSFEPIVREAIENNISDTIVEDVLKYFKAYIDEKEMKAESGYYNIPVEEFKQEFTESAFRRYNISDIKEALKIRGFIKCNAGRNDLSIKKEGKNYRYISFDAKKIKEKSNGK